MKSKNTHNNACTVDIAKPHQYKRIGELMVRVYSQLAGFPNPDEQPAYYDMLANIGNLAGLPKTKLLVATTPEGKIVGAVVYFGDMKYYGSGGSATHEINAAGFRLLAVDHHHRGQGIGRLLTSTCIEAAKKEGQEQVIIHSTKAMQVAWKMYEKMGFERSPDLDFKQESLPVYGFRLKW